MICSLPPGILTVTGLLTRPRRTAARGGAGGRTRCLCFSGAPFPNENEDFLRAGGHGKLDIGPLGKQDMMFQRWTECEKVDPRPGFSGGPKHNTVGIADTHTGELKGTSRCFDGLLNEFLNRQRAWEGAGTNVACPISTVTSLASR